MRLDVLSKEIAADEGRKEEIYLDHLGYPTVGIGHLIKESDKEYGMPVGTRVTSDRVDELFTDDIAIVVLELAILFPDYEEFPEEVQHILLNMMFQMGRPRLSKFMNMRRAIAECDWPKAAVEMLDSRWAKQTPNRANRLAERMRNVV